MTDITFTIMLSKTTLRYFGPTEWEHVEQIVLGSWQFPRGRSCFCLLRRPAAVGKGCLGPEPPHALKQEQEQRKASNFNPTGSEISFDFATQFELFS